MSPKVASFIWRWVVNMDSSVAEKLSGAAVTAIFGNRKVKPLALRMLVDMCQRIDPLNAETTLPAISVIIPAVEKDFWSLRHVIDSAISNSSNPVARISVVTPAHNLAKLRAIGLGHLFVSEESLVGEDLLSWVKEQISIERQGWVIQQIVKFIGVLDADTSASLVLDADTVLLRNRTWVTHDGKQLLMRSWEYHEPYFWQTRQFWPELKKNPVENFSFVTHHQLMQKDIVDRMFGGKRSAIKDWILAGDSRQESGFSEYQSYGQYISTLFAGRVAVGKWGNRAISPRQSRYIDFENSKAKAIHALSLSFHAYLK